MKQVLRSMLLGLLLTALSVGSAIAVTITTTGSGNWSSVTPDAPWPGGTLPGSGDDVVIADGHTVTIDQAVSVASLTVGQGTSGTLTFDGIAARAVTVSGDVVVATGGTFITQTTGTFTNTMSIGGNLTNNGIFDMSRGGTTLLCNVTFTKVGDQTISGSGTTTRFRGITLNKGGIGNRVTSSINVLMANLNITFTSGTWEQTANTLTATSGSQTVAATGALIISGTGSINIASNLTVNGTLTVNTGGTVTVGTGSGQLSFDGNTSVGNFTAGTVNINRFSATNGAAVTISGAVLNVDPQAITGTQNAFAYSTGTGGTSLTFTSGTITILNPITAAYSGTGGGREFQITTSGVVNISGTATVVLGQGAGTLSGPNGFRINCAQANTLQNLIINTGSNTVKSTAANVTVKGTLTLTSGIDSIGAQSIDGGIFNTPVTLGLYNPIAGTASNLKHALHSATGLPLSSIRILGSASGITIPGNIGQLKNLTIDNPNGTTLQSNLNVDTTLTLTSGAIALNGNTLSYGAGGRLVYSGLSSQTTTDAEFPSSNGPNSLTISNVAGVVLHASRTVNGVLTLTSGNIVLNGQTLTLGSSTSTPGTLIYTAGNMTGFGTFTRWFGSGLISGTAGTFPMGVDANNRSFAISGTVTTGGTVSVSYTDANTVTTLGVPIIENSQTFVNRYDAQWIVNSGFPFACPDLSFAIHGDGIPGINAVSDLNVSAGFVPAPGTFSAASGTTAAPVVNRTGLSEVSLSSTYYIISTSSSSLPIQLASFSGRFLSTGTVRLDWMTVSEVNNYGFYVQRRGTGVVNWEEIPNSFVAGHGTTNTPQQYSFVDNAVLTGRVHYRLKQLDLDGALHYTEPIHVDELTDVKESAPIEFALNQNYPNPFNPSTEVKFSVEKTGKTSLEVFSLIGEKVATLFDDVAEAGRYYQVRLDAKNLSSGTYLYRLQSGEKTQIKRMLLLK